MQKKFDVIVRLARLRQVALATSVAVLALCGPALASTFVVNSTGDGADAVPGNGVCADSSGNCTLRAAITEANATVGTDIINFGIGSGAQTINVLTQLDAITETVTINGATQPGFSGTPLIQLTGPGAGNANGLTINADNCVVRGLVINGFGAGIVITGMASNPIAQGNVVAGCYIGTNASGTAIAAVPNGYGVYMADNGGVADSGAQGNTIGGLTASDRNVISGNSNHTGIIIGGSVTGFNVIRGNYIGTDASGTGAVPNSYVGGIWLLSPNNVIGGPTAGARNVISGNSNGIFLGGANAHDNIVQGNYIGTNANGTAALGNSSGIIIGDDTQNPNSGAHDNIIGGSATGAGNLISGNSTGVSIGNGFTADNTTGNVVEGNYIGTNAAGTGAVANNVGVAINGGAKGNSIGGTTVGAGNAIAFNTLDGVNVNTNASLTPNGNSIRGNSIYSNGGLGINLQPTGEADNTITPNDALDDDSGPNTLQNFPLIASFIFGSSTTTVTGTLNSTANQTFNLDFFSSPAADPSGNGEGQTYLGAPVSGSATVTTNGSGDASFSVTFNGNLSGQFLTATATSSTGDTSEFGPAVKAVPSLSINSVSILEGNLGDANKLLNFTVTLSQASPQTVTVKYATANSTAIQPSDYTTTSGTLTFAPGQTTKYISVPIIGDSLDEDNETFFINLSNATNATIADSQGLGTINDDDVKPTISIADKTVTESTGSNINTLFTVTLSAASGRTVTVNYATANGTATQPSDYTTTSGTLTFAPGQTTKYISVPIIGDSLDEDNETFFVNLSNATNATIADNQGLGTINDDDVKPTISIADKTVTESTGSNINTLFTVTLSAASGRTVTVNYATANGTATQPSDYTTTSGTLTFAPGQTTKYISVPIIGDSLDEDNETFFVNLSNATNATIADNQGLGTINDDDVKPTISINDVGVTEGNAGTKTLIFTVSLGTPSGRTVMVDYATANNTATQPSDYTATSGTLTFTAGQTSKMISVVIKGDTTVEGDETFFVNLSVPTNANLGRARGIGTILNNDPASMGATVGPSDDTDEASK